MLMEEFQKWKESKECVYDDDRDKFDIFYQHKYACKPFVEIMADLAYQIYHIQVCIEGLVEDAGDD